MNEAERYLQERLRTQAAAQAASFSAPPPVRQRMVSIGTAWKYFWTRWTFSGRASRSEYWWTQLVLLLAVCGISFSLGFLLAVIGVDDLVNDAIADVFGWLWNLATLVPGICLQVRRLHDTNHSGHWWWFVLLPIIGWIILLVLMCTRSDPAANRYGPVPNTEA